jgi:hypothetical protein
VEDVMNNFGRVQPTSVRTHDLDDLIFNVKPAELLFLIGIDLAVPMIQPNSVSDLIRWCGVSFLIVYLLLALLNMGCR